MSKKHRDLPVHQCPHPSFPSFAWVMTAQANPPSPAYAYGYIRNAQAQARPRAHRNKHACSPARRTVPPGLHQHPPSHSQPTTRPRTSAMLPAERERSSEKFMETVDYRYHDPPSRPYVPWLEGYTLPRRGASSAQRQVIPHDDEDEDEDEDKEELVLPTGFTTIAEPPTVSASPSLSKCRFADSASGSDDARPKKKKRSRTGTTVDVKINRLDIALDALRRAFGLFAREEPSKSS